MKFGRCGLIIGTFLCSMCASEELIGPSSIIQARASQGVRDIELFDVGTEAHQAFSSLTLYDQQAWISVEGQFGQGVFGSTTLLTPNSWW